MAENQGQNTNQHLMKSDDGIKIVLGGIQSKTEIENTILEVQEPAEKWIKFCSTNNVMKTEAENNNKFINEIEKLATQLEQNDVKAYFMSNDVSAEHLLNSLYCLNALANYHLYNNHNGERARKILLNSKKLAEQYVVNRSKRSITFDGLNKAETLMELSIIKDLPELYTIIIYLLARTYIYQGDKNEAKPYFELSKYLGNELKLFEGFLSEGRGLGLIEREAIERGIANQTCSPAQAIDRLNKSVKLYLKLKSDDNEYKEGYKPGIGENKKIIPAEDTYNQIDCSEHLIKHYMLLISLTEDKTKLAEYLNELSNQLIGNNKSPSMLKQLKDVLPKKLATIYNTLGKTLLKLYDQNIEFHKFKVEISKELALEEKEELIERDDLSFIRQIFTSAKEISRQSDFNKADAYDGLTMVCRRQLEQKDLEESERKKLLSSISENEKSRDEINKELNRVTGS
jgi:hypothetical protein